MTATSWHAASWRARSRVDGMRAPPCSSPPRIARRSWDSICDPSVPGASRETESISSKGALGSPAPADGAPLRAFDSNWSRAAATNWIFSWNQSSRTIVPCPPSPPHPSSPPRSPPACRWRCSRSARSCTSSASRTPSPPPGCSPARSPSGGWTRRTGTVTRLTALPANDRELLGHGARQCGRPRVSL